MEGEVRVELQVVYLDSALEVGDVHDVFDVLPKAGEEFCRPWSSRPEKNKNLNKTEWRFQAEDPTCWVLSGGGTSFTRNAEANSGDPGASACTTSSIVGEPVASDCVTSILRRLIA